MATLLPNAKQQFIDANGAPVAGGTVGYYIPGTLTPKDTWQDSGATTLNTNPVILDASGEAVVYGSGIYRQIVLDAGGNLIWDQLTADTAVGGLAWGGTSTGTANAQVIAASSFSQQDGQQIAFIAGYTNTGPLTVAPGGGSPIAVLKDGTGGPVPLIGGEVAAGNAVNLIYDAARGAFHIENTSINGSAPATNAQTLAASSTAVYLTPANLSLERTLFGLGIPMLNGVITSSVAGNAVTFALTGLDGNAPSSAEPVYVAFRNSTATNGNYVVRTITAAATLTLSSGVTLGTANGVPFRIWIVAVDTGTGIQLGAVNTLSGVNIMALQDNSLYTTSTPGNSAQTIYTTSGLSSEPVRLLGYFDWASGLVTAGTWASDATYKQLFGPGVPRPGDVVQIVRTDSGAVATGTTILPYDNSIPQITEGDQYLSQAITPTASPNILAVNSTIVGAVNAANLTWTTALFRDATANALAAVPVWNGGNVSQAIPGALDWKTQAASISSTTLRVRAGPNNTATFTLNGGGGTRLLGGVMNSFIQVQELMV